MHVILHYQGQYRKAFVFDEVERWGERFIEAYVEGFKIPKMVHFNAIKQFDWAANTPA